MKYFKNLNQIVESLETDESTRNDPIKRAFVFDGKHLTANVGIVRDSGNALHGPILEEGQSFAALSVFAPYFDRSKNNIAWDRDSA